MYCIVMMHNNNNGVQHKVVFLGETSVGKSSIVSRFTRDEFFDFQEPTIGAAFQTKNVQLDNCIVKMEFWDTAGQERYRSLAPMYYRGASVAFIVYDITNPDTLNNAKYWINQIKNKGERNCIIVLLGNKNDLSERRIEREKGINVSEINNTMFSEVSAKTGDNINDIMIQVAKRLALIPQTLQKPEEFTIQSFDNKNTCCM